jgi:hypothetical protein
MEALRRRFCNEIRSGNRASHSGDCGARSIRPDRWSRKTTTNQIDRVRTRKTTANQIDMMEKNRGKLDVMDRRIHCTSTTEAPGFRCRPAATSHEGLARSQEVARYREGVRGEEGPASGF